MLAVSPGQFGIGLFSPPLDATGNSVRGVLACERLAARFGLHLLHDATAGASAAKVLPDGDVLRLRGDIDFAAAELVLRLSRERGGAPLELDLSGVTRLHPVAQRLLEALHGVRSGVTVVWRGPIRSEISAPPVAATTSTPATATIQVSSAKPIPITPNWSAEVAIVCGIHRTDQMPTPVMPITDSTASGASRSQ